MTRLLAVLAVGVLAGIAVAERPPPGPVEHKSDTGRYTVTFPARSAPASVDKELATSAGNLTVWTTKGESAGAVYAVTYTDYPESFGIVNPKEILEGVVNRMKGDDGKATVDDTTLEGVSGKVVTVTAGENVVRAKVFLVEQRLYIVTVSGKKETTRGDAPDKFLSSFAFTK